MFESTFNLTALLLKNFHLRLHCCTLEYAVVSLQYASVKSYSVAKSPYQTAENLRLIVSVFMCTLELTVLLLKSFHLHIDCDTL